MRHGRDARAGRAEQAVTEADLPALARELEAQAAERGRWMLGIAGAPGSGKSTVAARLAELLGSACVVLPMDGFHLPIAALTHADVARRGAPDTFDATAFVALLRRVRARDDVAAPSFDHDVGDPVQRAIPVPADAAVVIVEGSYLLLDDEPWSCVAPLLDETWMVELDRDERQHRLAVRHERSGKSRVEAHRFATVSDEANAQRVAASTALTDRVLRR